MPFLNVENDGKWLPGGTYTFDYYTEWTSTFPESPYWTETGWTLVSDEYVYKNNYDPYTGGYMGYGTVKTGWGTDDFLFDNNTTVGPSDHPGTPFEGAITGLTIDDITDLGDGTFRYTVTVAEDVTLGTYYLRGAYTNTLMMLV